MMANLLLPVRPLRKGSIFLSLLLLPWLVAAQSPAFPSFPDSAHQYWAGIPKVPRLSLQLPLSPKFIRVSAVAIVGASAWGITYEHLDEPLRTVSLQHGVAGISHAARWLEPLGRQKYLAPLAGLVLVGGLTARDAQLQRAGMVALGSILTNAVVTQALKRAFQRHRPSATDENDLFDGPLLNTTNRSFPSSHTSTAFAVASSFAIVYQDHPYIPYLAYGMASLVGLSRVAQNAHWASDVMAGAAVGFLSAKGVNYLYALGNRKLDQRRYSLQILPTYAGGSMGISAKMVW